MSTVFPVPEDTRFRLTTAVGGETSASVPFPFQDNADIALVKYAVDGTEVPWTEGVHYTLTGAGSPGGGTATFAAPLVAGEKILRVGRAVIDRVTSVVRDGRFSSRAIDDDLDRWIMIAQELARDVARSWQAPIGSSGGEIKPGGAGTAAIFDEAGNLVEGPSAAEIAAAEEYALRAEDALSEIILTGSTGFDTRSQAVSYRPKVLPSKIVLNGYYLAGDTSAPLIFVPGDPGTPGGINITLDDEVTVEPYELRSNTPTPQMFGFVANGTSLNAAALAAADDYALLLGKELLLPAGAYRIGASITIDSPLRLMPGAYFQVDAGATLTFAGRLTLPFEHVFRGAGVTAFGNAALSLAQPEWWGAKADGLDATAPANNFAIQKAMDVKRSMLLDHGEYRTSASLGYNFNGGRVVGQGRANTTIRYIGTTGPVLHNPDKATTTRLFCALIGVKVMAPNLNTTSRVVDWQSMQFWTIDDFWITGASVAGCTALWLGAVWVTTECTYGTLASGYIGLCSVGIRWDDGANNIKVSQVRVQASVASGFGALLLSSTSGAGRISANLIEICGFEFPGQINTGVFASTGVDGLILFADRFESLSAAINVAAGADHVDINAQSHHFSSNATKIIVPASGNSGVVPSPMVRAYINGTTLAIQRSFGVTGAVTRKAGFAAGGYRIPVSAPDNGFFPLGWSNLPDTRVTAMSATFVEVETRDAAGTLTDAAILTVWIDAQRF